MDFQEQLVAGATDRAHLAVDAYKYIVLALDVAVGEAKITEGDLDLLETEPARAQQNREVMLDALGCMAGTPAISLVLMFEILMEYVIEEMSREENKNIYSSAFRDRIIKRLDSYKEVITENGGDPAVLDRYYWMLSDEDTPPTE